MLIADWYCASGVPTSCASGGAEVACSECGCPVGELCDELSGACAPPAAVGEACSDNGDCASRNCGDAAGDAAYCFVEAGAPCDGTNCGECVMLPDGGTECLQACDDSVACGADEGLCWGTTVEEASYYCREPCSAFDPSSCRDGYECREVRDRSYNTYYRCFPLSIDRGPATYGCDAGEVADECGTCDADPTNDCVADCAGVFGGGSTLDMCGTCDADASNDCVQDCAGEWGGSSTMDPCGTCDADPENDGNIDPCGVCDTDPTNDCVPVCTWGERLLGGCWFVSNIGSDCVSECYTRGGTYSEQTRRVAGSDGTREACHAIVQAWQPSVTSTTSAFGHGGIGCSIQRPAVFGDPSYGRHHTDVETGPYARADGFARLCACAF